MTVEYSDAITNMMLSAPRQAVLLAGGVAFGSTDRMDEKALARFWAKVDRGPGCWEWTGYRSTRGYGRFALGRALQAHRVAYELVVGPIPAGLELDHLCRNRGCVRPDHLEPVTTRENVIRGVGPVAVNAAKTHCHRGHELSGDNVRFVAARGRLTERQCKACESINRKAPDILARRRAENARWYERHGAERNAKRRERRRDA